MKNHAPLAEARRVCLLSLGCLLVAAMAVSRAGAEEPARTDEDVRYLDRGSVAVPEAAVFDEAPVQRRATSFPALVDEIVSQLDFDTYDGYLRDLSGDRAITVGGSPFTIQTRYSLSSPGQVCWQFVYETLEAMGYEVRYQEYSRSGNDLKNIIARIPGETNPNDVYVLGGHLDSISPQANTLAPGAEDNGSGSAAILAAAAALIDQRFESTIELVLFTGEEQGLWGSQAYVDDALSEGVNLVSAVTCDMISAWENDYGVLIEGENAWQSLMFLVGDAVDSYTNLERDYSYFSFGSDHVPFQDVGIPAILAIDLDWASYDHYHRTTDTYDKLDPTLGHKVAKACLAAVVHQAGPLGPVVSAPTPELASLRAFPNPAMEQVHLSLAVGTDASSTEPIVARVFDVQGRQLRTLADVRTTPVAGTARSGVAALQEATWDLRDASGGEVRPGIYWIRMGDSSERVVVIR